MKKNNNPFMMIGSWLGFIAGLFSMAIINNWDFSHQITFMHVVFGIAGFLLGWGIEVLLRKLIKK
jgi:hypothetical protein